MPATWLRLVCHSLREWLTLCVPRSTHFLSPASSIAFSLALMEAQGPEWRELWSPDQSGVLLENIGWCGPSKEVEVQHSANHSEGKPVFCQDDVHAIAVQEKYPSGCPVCITWQTNWVSPNWPCWVERWNHSPEAKKTSHSWLHTILLACFWNCWGKAAVIDLLLWDALC